MDLVHAFDGVLIVTDLNDFNGPAQTTNLGEGRSHRSRRAVGSPVTSPRPRGSHCDASQPGCGSPPGRVQLPNSWASLTMPQAGYCALRRSSPFQFWWIWPGKSRPRCSPQCIPVTRRRRSFFRKTGGVEETFGESLPLRQTFPKTQHIQVVSACHPEVSYCSLSHRRHGLTPGILSSLCFNPARSNRSWLRPSRWLKRLKLCVTSLRAAPSAELSSQSDAKSRQSDAIADACLNVLAESVIGWIELAWKTTPTPRRVSAWGSA